MVQQQKRKILKEHFISFIDEEQLHKDIDSFRVEIETGYLLAENGLTALHSAL